MDLRCRGPDPASVRLEGCLVLLLLLLLRRDDEALRSSPGSLEHQVERKATRSRLQSRCHDQAAIHLLPALTWLTAHVSFDQMKGVHERDCRHEARRQWE